MKRIVQRKAIDLSTEEKEEITSLIRRYYPNIEKEYLVSRVSHECKDDIVLLKDEKNLLGVSYYSVHKVLTPFDSKEIHVIKFGQALKQEDYPKSVIWKLGNWYALRNISYFYPIKKIVGVSTIGSPKVFEHFTKLFPNHFPDKTRHIDNREVIAFLNAYFNKNQSMDITIEPDFCFDYPGILETDITSDWEKKYKAKDESINDLFVSSGIIEFRNGKVYKSSRTLVACGYKLPFTNLKRKMFNN
jgi:hypothetical protein